MSDTEKTCLTCGRTLPMARFKTVKSTGKVYMSKHCSTCRSGSYKHKFDPYEGLSAAQCDALNRTDVKALEHANMEAGRCI